jgi:putative redox protein
MGVQKNSARVMWKGENLDFSGTFGSGFDFDMGGGPNKKAGSPMEFLLAGVAGCTAVDVVLILQKQRQKVSGVEVEATGARAPEPPQVYTEIELVYVVRGEDIDPAAVERVIALSEEKYCSASATFVQAGVAMRSTYRIESSD